MLDDEVCVRLLSRIAGEQVSIDPVGAARIVDACGGLPLAVRLAGAKLAARPHWTAGMMAERLTGGRGRRLAVRATPAAV